MVFIEISEGIGAAIIIGNNIFRGSNYSAGEVGFIIQRKKNLYSNYGNIGYMERDISPRNIIKSVVKAIKNGEKTLITEIVSNNLAKIDISVVFKSASLGDALAKKIIKNVVERLAIIAINITLILNPQLLVIGGDICNFPGVSEFIIEPTKTIVNRIIPFKSPEIKLSKTGKDSGIIGTSLFAIENLIKENFIYKLIES